MKEMIEGHLCNGIHLEEKSKGRIKPWIALVCSQCMGENSVDVVMAKEDIDEHNRKWLEERSQNSPE